MILTTWIWETVRHGPVERSPVSCPDGYMQPDTWSANPNLGANPHLTSPSNQPIVTHCSIYTFEIPCCSHNLKKTLSVLLPYHHP